MKKFKNFKYFLALVLALVIAVAPAKSVFATEPQVTINEDGTRTEVTKETSEDGSTVVTTTIVYDADGNVISKDVDTQKTVSRPQEMSRYIYIHAPEHIYKPENGYYNVPVTIDTNVELEGIRVIKGMAGFDQWDSAEPFTPPTLSIPEPESDSWYTVMAISKDGNVKGMAHIYAHCDPTPTPTATPTPTTTPSIQVSPEGTPTPTQTPGCPDGYVMDENGNCYKEEVGCPEGYHMENGVCVPNNDCPEGMTKDQNGNCVCPEGYQMDSTGKCIKIPVATPNKTCPEGQYMDANGNCVPKIASLPQTGGFDSLMMFFIFGLGLAGCGAGVIAYANKKGSNNAINDEENEIEDDEIDE